MSRPAAYLPYFWLAALATVLVFHDGIMSAHYLPKTVWASSVLALGFLVTRPARPREFAPTVLALIWMAYVAWAVLSLAWAPAPWPGLVRWWALLLPTMAYVFARRTRFWESERFWDIFAGLAGLVAIVGLLQYAAGVSGRLAHLWPFSAVTGLPGNGPPVTTEGQRNYASMFFALTLPFLVWRLYVAKGWRVWLSLAWLSAVVLFVLIAKTRTAWLGLGAGVLFVMVGGTWRRFAAKRLQTALLLAPVLIAACVVGAQPVRFTRALGLDATKKGKTTLMGTAESLFQASDRTVMWSECLGITSPWRGAGFGNFPVLATPFDKLGQTKTLNWEVHDDYLQAYLDLGWPGVLLFIGAFLWMIWLGWCGRGEGVVLAAGAAAVAMTVMQVTIFTSEVVSSQMLFAGIVAILNDGTRSRPLRPRSVGPLLSYGANYATAVFLAVLAILAGRAMAADRVFASTVGQLAGAKSRPAAEQSRLETSLRQAVHSAAFDALPTVWFDANMAHIYCHRLAPLAYDLKDHPAAAAFANEAVKLHPNDAASLAVLGRLEAEDGHQTEAVALLKRARTVAIHDPDARASCQLAQCLLKQGLLAEATDSIESALRTAGSIDNPYSYGLNILLQILDQTGGKDRAAELRAVAAKNKTTAPALESPPEGGEAELGADGNLRGVTFQWGAGNAAVEYCFQIATRNGKGDVTASKSITTTGTLVTCEQLAQTPFEPASARFALGEACQWSVYAVGKYDPSLTRADSPPRTLRIRGAE